MNINRIDKIFSYIKQRTSPIRKKITIGKIESSSIDGYWGTSIFCAALVPLFCKDKLMNSNEESGHEVEYSGVVPISQLTDLFTENFYVRGLLNDQIQLEPLVSSWQKHNKKVYIPDSKLLANYYLVSRNSGQKIYWDDPSIPRYNVIEVIPTSNYTIDNGSTLSKVEVERDYLEDYAFLKKCAIVEFYFEERWIHTDEPVINSILSGENGKNITQVNRRIKLIKTNFKNYKYNIQIWGRQLILIPKSSPISSPKPILLKWPGLEDELSEEDARKSIVDYVYVLDHYLIEYENKEEFTLYPESGSINYEGRWMLSFCQREGRDYVRCELRKLYEGVPAYITKEINKYAVEKEIVNENILKFGNRNIASRARKVIYGYLNLFSVLAKLFYSVELFYDDEKLCLYSKEKIDYYGWFHFMELRKLGNVAKLESTENDFLNRCRDLYILFESTQEKPLRDFFEKINIQTDKIKSLKTIKLLELIIKILKVSTDSGLKITSNPTEILKRINFPIKLEEISFMFFLYDIRTYASHRERTDTIKKYHHALDFFNIDNDFMKSHGWGIAIDKVYDKIITSLETIKNIVNKYPS